MSWLPDHISHNTLLLHICAPELVCAQWKKAIVCVCVCFCREWSTCSAELTSMQTCWTVVVSSRHSWMILFLVAVKSLIPVRGVLRADKGGKREHWKQAMDCRDELKFIVLAQIAVWPPTGLLLVSQVCNHSGASLYFSVFFSPHSIWNTCFKNQFVVLGICLTILQILKQIALTGQ